MNRTYFCIFRSAWRCFFFYWHPGEGSLMKCVWASVCEAHFEVNLFVLCLTCNRLFWKGRLSDWSSLIFSLCCVLLAFLCSSSHLRLSVSLFSDKTVKIWLSKVWRKRWQLKCSLCGPPCCFLSAWSATCSLRLKTQFPKQSRCFFFLCQGAKWQSRGGIRIQRQKNYLPFRFFFDANLKVPCRCDTTWTR